jgi:TRAP-type C4-dicarboxylate transport system substrate-binding protein
MRMKKIHLLAALGLTLICTASHAARTYTVPTSVPEGSFFFENFLVRFAKNADLLTDGEVKIRPVGAGVIVPALQVFESVQNGVQGRTFHLHLSGQPGSAQQRFRQLSGRHVRRGSAVLAVRGQRPEIPAGIP